MAVAASDKPVARASPKSVTFGVPRYREVCCEALYPGVQNPCHEHRRERHISGQRCQQHWIGSSLQRLRDVCQGCSGSIPLLCRHSRPEPESHIQWLCFDGRVPLRAGLLLGEYPDKLFPQMPSGASPLRRHHDEAPGPLPGRQSPVPPPLYVL